MRLSTLDACAITALLRMNDMLFGSAAGDPRRPLPSPREAQRIPSRMPKCAKKTLTREQLGTIATLIRDTVKGIAAAKRAGELEATAKHFSETINPLCVHFNARFIDAVCRALNFVNGSAGGFDIDHRAGDL